MKRNWLPLLILILIPVVSYADTIDVKIKGVDDGIKTTKQQDYKEAVLFAKREAIERAGLKVKSLTTAKDFVIQSDYIESEAEAVLLPGYDVIDIGYQQDGTYLVILIGTVKTKTLGAGTNEVERDGNYIRYSNGVVKDENTGLEWFVGPDEETTWQEAKKWVWSLTVAGGGWRMPSRLELETLYKKGSGNQNMTPLLRTIGSWVWSGEARNSSYAWFFDFGRGKMFFYSINESHVFFRAFAVRTGK